MSQTIRPNEYHRSPDQPAAMAASVLTLARHATAAVAISFLFISALSAGTTAAAPADGDKAAVRVAVAGPMVGTSFAVGQQYRAGVTAAWEAGNRQVLGRPVVIEPHDDNCVGPMAESVARKLVEDRPDVVIGHSCSAATLAAAPHYAQAGILEITPASTNPKVTEMGFGTIFRMIGRDDLQGVIAAREVAQNQGAKRIAVVHALNPYGQGLAATAAAELRRLGVEPLMVTGFEPAQPSYLPLVDTLIAARPDALMLFGGALDSAVILRQTRQLDGTFQVFGSDTMVSEVFGQAAGATANGVRFTFPPDVARFPSAATAVAALHAKGVDPIGYTLLAYAAYEVWRTGVERAGGTDSTTVAQAIRSKPIDTILGPVRFDDKGDITGPADAFVWYRWQDGKRQLSPP